MQVGGCTSWLAGPMDQPMNARRSSWDCTGIGASQRTCSPCRQDTHPGGDFEGRGEREASWRETGSTRTWDLRRLCVLVGGVCMEGGKSSTPGQSHQQCPARTHADAWHTHLAAGRALRVRKCRAGDGPDTGGPLHERDGKDEQCSAAARQWRGHTASIAAQRPLRQGRHDSVFLRGRALAAAPHGRLCRRRLQKAVPCPPLWLVHSGASVNPGCCCAADLGC